MRVELPYGDGRITGEIAEGYRTRVLERKLPPAVEDPGALVRAALANPIGARRLAEVVRPGEKVVVVTSDITRPFPARVVLPHVLEELEAAGVSLSDVTVVFGLGIHRPQTEEERRRLVGEEIYLRVRCVDSSSGDVVCLGRTRRGTPLDVDRRVVEADRRVCLGNLEYHYFAGYSGGVKAILPGASSRRTVEANHSMMVMDAARAGKLEGNPVREDIDELVEHLPVDFIVNVVPGSHGAPAAVVAGHPIMAHREGCRLVDRWNSVAVDELADVVLVSAGGSPKDVNLYQAQKALDNAAHAVKDGGRLILVARCQEGFGEPTFEIWLREARGPEDCLRRVSERFELGGHKAAALARTAARVRIIMVTDMPEEDVATAFAERAGSLEEALAGGGGLLYVIPEGGSVLPRLGASGH